MITEIITTISIMAAIATVLSEYLSKLTKAEGFLAQLESWVVSVALVFVASFLGISVFATLGTLPLIVYGVLIGFVSNGLFDIPWVKAILDLIKARIKPVA